MSKRILSALVVFTMLTTSLISYPVSVSAETVSAPEGWRKLVDVNIFKDGSSIGGWSGSGAGELETVNSSLPIDTTEKYNSLPSVKLSVSKEVTSWWTSLLTIRGWCCHDLSQYVSGGFLEFDLKGKVGGENFKIGLRDKVNERKIGESVDVIQTMDKYAAITTEWKHVKIPLKDIADTSKGFDPKEVLCIVMNPVDSKPFTVWLNNIKITSPDNEKSYGAIKVNQVGYIPNNEKTAIVSGFDGELKVKAGDEFEVRRASNDEAVFKGKLTLLKDYDAVDSGERVLGADFSSLNDQDEFYIYVKDLDKSPKFEIGSGIYKSLLYDASRYFYYQRANIELTEEFTPEYPRKDKTPQDAAAIYDSNPEATREVTKGWHDAGDYGKYVNAGATAVSDLFWSYEMFPKQFVDNQLNIPESGNKIPDILDEAKWELDWMLKMQDGVSGGFYARVQSDEDTKVTKRIIKDKNGNTTNILTTDDTASAAAVLAHAYIIYNKIDADFANKCLGAAKSAWKFLEKNPNNIMSPPGPYNVTNDSSDRLWAAATLYRATGEDLYNTYFLNNYKNFKSKFEDSTGYAQFVGENWLTAFFNYTKAEKVDDEAYVWISRSYAKWYSKIVNRYNNNPWKNAIADGNYFWGSNMQVLNVPMAAYIGSQTIKFDSNAEDFGLGSLNWILGKNPISKSYVSGHGEGAIKQVFSSIYATDGKSGIPNGYLAGGCNRYEGAGISNFPAKSYVESACDWVTNEHTIYWNSPLVFMSALANNIAGVDSQVSISGYVKPDFKSDNKSIKAGFKVQVKGTDLSALTDSDGFFKIDGLNRIRGFYDLEISKASYLTRTVKNVIGSKDSKVSTSEKPIEMWAGDIKTSLPADGVINMIDVMTLAKTFSSNSSEERFNKDVDFDMDDNITMADVLIIAKHFGCFVSDYPEIDLSIASAKPTPTSTSTPSVTATPTPSSDPGPKSDIVIYDDALKGFANWSWNAKVEDPTASPVKTGTASLGVGFTGAWGALSLCSSQKIDAKGYDAISFFVNGGETDVKMKLAAIYDATDETATGTPFEFTAKAGVWTEVKVKLADLGITETIQRINIQDISGLETNKIYVDDVKILAESAKVEPKILKVYEDELGTGFQNWSWLSTVNFSEETNVKEGTAAISVEYTDAWAALSLYSATKIDTAGYDTIKFWVNGGDSNKTLGVSTIADAAVETSNSPTVQCVAKAGAWTEVSIKLSDLGSPATIQRLNVQDSSGKAQTPIYIDDIRLIGGGETTEKPKNELTTLPRTDKVKISTAKYSLSDVALSDVKATNETSSLFAALRGIGGNNIMFGHQSATTTGITTKGVKDGTKSDTFNDVGAYPAVYGWDTLSIEGYENPGSTSYTAEENIKLLADVIKKAYARGGVNTLSSHMPNFVNGGNFYKTTGDVVANILPGGSKNADYNKFLDNVAALANQLKDENGKLIPVIFRPFHENTGSWFWWGASFCTPDQYIKLYRYTVEYLRDTKGVHNFLYAYSPSSDFVTEEEFLVRYPGDAYVDVLGFDQYDDSTTEAQEEAWMKSIVARAELMTTIADKRGKVFAITETGIASGIKNENNLNKEWFTDLLNAIKASAKAGKTKAAYMLTWANFGLEQFWVPYKDHSTYGNNELLQDFVNFYNDDFAVFGDTIGSFYGFKVKIAAQKPFMYISSPYGGNIITGDTKITAKVFENGKTVKCVDLFYPSVVDGSVLSMKKGTDGLYSAIWKPEAQLNGKKATLEVRVEYTDGLIQKESITVKVLGSLTVKQYDFDENVYDITYEGTYAPKGASVSGVVGYDANIGNGAAIVDAVFVDDAASQWTYQEIKVKLPKLDQDLMSMVNKAKVDILLPESAKDTLFKPYGIIYVPTSDGYKKCNEGEAALHLENFTQDSEETGKYGKLYRYTLSLDITDKTATDLVLAFVAFDWDYKGPIIIDNVKYLNEMKPLVKLPEIVDSFEGYFNDQAELEAAFTKAGDSNAISLVPHNNGNAVKLEYNIASNGYSGIVKQLGSVDWTKFNALSLWYTPDGLGQKMVVQIKANGKYFEVYPSMADKEAKTIDLKFADFKPAPWQADQTCTLAENLAAIEAVGVYVNGVEDFKGEGTLLLDEIKAIYNSAYGDLGVKPIDKTAVYGFPFDFESDANSWKAKFNYDITIESAVSDTWASNGKKSLKADAQLTEPEEKYSKYILVLQKPMDFTGKKTLTAEVKAATATGSFGSELAAKLFVQSGAGWTWVDSGHAALENDKSATFTINLENVKNIDSIQCIGVEFDAGAGCKGTASFYIDNVRLD